jgi:hypothetical protein
VLVVVSQHFRVLCKRRTTTGDLHHSGTLSIWQTVARNHFAAIERILIQHYSHAFEPWVACCGRYSLLSPMPSAPTSVLDCSDSQRHQEYPNYSLWASDLPYRLIWAGPSHTASLWPGTVARDPRPGSSGMVVAHWGNFNSSVDSTTLPSPS